MSNIVDTFEVDKFMASDPKKEKLSELMKKRDIAQSHINNLKVSLKLDFAAYNKDEVMRLNDSGNMEISIDDHVSIIDVPLAEKIVEKLSLYIEEMKNE